MLVVHDIRSCIEAIDWHEQVGERRLTVQVHGAACSMRNVLSTGVQTSLTWEERTPRRQVGRILLQLSLNQGSLFIGAMTCTSKSYGMYTCRAHALTARLMHLAHWLTKLVTVCGCWNRVIE